MKYKKFTIQMTIYEDGKKVELEPLTYETLETEVGFNHITNRSEIYMRCKCVETGELFCTTERVCADWEKEGILKTAE